MTENIPGSQRPPKSLSSVEKAVAKLGMQSTTSASVSTPPAEPPPVDVAPAGNREPGATAPHPSAKPHPGVITETASTTSHSLPFQSDGSSRKTSKSVELDLDRMRTYGILGPESEHSLLAEEYRLIKRPILLKAMEKGPNSVRNSNLIMVASARPGEGKTFTAISLAMSIASEPDLTVLLVDADVAKSNIPDVLGFHSDRGLIDVISDDTVDLSDVLLRTQMDNLSILPAGRSHHLATEYLASDRMARLVDDIADRYSDRIIIFDSPPVLMSSVPSVLALHVGQTIFVIEADHTPQAAIENALSLVSSCKNVSLLLNKSRAIAGTDKFGAYYYR